MTYIVVLLVVLVIVGLYMHNQKSRVATQTAETGSGPLPYMKKDYLLTRAERALLDFFLEGNGERHPGLFPLRHILFSMILLLV